MRPTATMLVAILVLAAAACSGPEATGPEAALQEFYRHLNAGDYTEATSLYSGEAREVVEDPDAFGDAGFEGWARDVTKNGSISRVEVLSETVDVDSASTRVEYEVVFDDGSRKKGTVQLTEEGGQWKLGLLS